MIIDLDNIVQRIVDETSGPAPTRKDLDKTIRMLGVAEAALIIAALHLLYDIKRDKPDDSAPTRWPVCPQYKKDGKKCKALIIHSKIEKDGAETFLIRVCEKKHITRSLLPEV